MTLAVQGLIFSCMLLLGISLGLWADLLRCLAPQNKGAAVVITDLIFWFSALTVTVIVLLWLNCFELRLYAFVGMAAGNFIYYQWIGRSARRFYYGLLAALVKGLKSLVRILKPLLSPLRFLAACADSLSLSILSAIALAVIEIKDLIHFGQEIPPTT